jgi:hypothetical protein
MQMPKNVPYNDPDLPFANPGNSPPPMQGVTQSTLSAAGGPWRVPTVIIGASPAPQPDPNAALGGVVQQLLKQSQFGDYPATPTWQNKKG